MSKDNLIKEEPPRCHFKVMELVCADIPYGWEEFWECQVCGHTKEYRIGERS